MTKLDDFNKIIWDGNEISKVYHAGEVIWDSLRLGEYENLALRKLFSTRSYIDRTQLSFLTDGDIKTDSKRMTETFYSRVTFTLDFGYEAIVQNIIMYSGEGARNGSYAWPYLSATINGEIFEYGGATNLYKKELPITDIKASSVNITTQGSYGGVYEIEIWGKKIL